VPVIRVETRIHAPIERCFDYARDLDLHATSLRHTNERAVAGVTTGLIELGQQVTWEATHFGIRQRLTSRISQFERPTRFRDSQVHGAFRRFDHDHLFQHEDGFTLMTDVFDYTAPLGPLGRLADVLFLARYMRNLLTQRGAAIREAAESF
jgi:ligand-binding SRPBCC domain-containing protein